MSITSILIICSIGLLVSLRDFPTLLRQRKIKELSIYVMMLGLGTWLSILGVNLEQLPSPLVLIEIIYNPIQQMLKHIFYT